MENTTPVITQPSSVFNRLKLLVPQWLNTPSL
jgi:hypothetical protein